MSATRVTPRGREVSELAMNCLNSKEISKRLGISHSGILRHRENMFLQKNCTAMSQLIAMYHGKCPVHVTMEGAAR